jgi:lactoylglutathione lyase
MNYQMIHSCIRVMNLEQSEKFYQQAFGFEISRRLDFPDHQFTLSYLKAPGGQFELELTYNYDQKEPYQLGNGYSHLAVGVADLEGSHQRHQEQGFDPKPLKGLAGGKAKFYFLADPDGYLVEVVRV